MSDKDIKHLQQEIEIFKKRINQMKRLYHIVKAENKELEWKVKALTQRLLNETHKEKIPLKDNKELVKDLRNQGLSLREIAKKNRYI